MHVHRRSDPTAHFCSTQTRCCVGIHRARWTARTLVAADLHLHGCGARHGADEITAPYRWQRERDASERDDLRGDVDVSRGADSRAGDVAHRRQTCGRLRVAAERCLWQTLLEWSVLGTRAVGGGHAL